MADHTVGVDHVGDPTGEQTEGLAHAPRACARRRRCRRASVNGRWYFSANSRWESTESELIPMTCGAGVGEVLEAVAERARLLRAAGRVVLRVEVHDDPAALQLREGDGRAMLVREGEVGCRSGPRLRSWRLVSTVRHRDIPRCDVGRWRRAGRRPGLRRSRGPELPLADADRRGGEPEGWRGQDDGGAGSGRRRLASRRPCPRRRPRSAGQRHQRARRVGPRHHGRRARSSPTSPGSARGLALASAWPVTDARPAAVRGGQHAGASPPVSPSWPTTPSGPRTACRSRSRATTTTWSSSTVRRRSACSR